MKRRDPRDRRIQTALTPAPGVPHTRTDAEGFNFGRTARRSRRRPGEQRAGGDDVQRALRRVAAGAWWPAVPRQSAGCEDATERRHGGERVGGGAARKTQAWVPRQRRRASGAGSAWDTAGRSSSSGSGGARAAGTRAGACAAVGRGHVRLHAAARAWWRRAWLWIGRRKAKGCVLGRGARRAAGARNSACVHVDRRGTCMCCVPRSDGPRVPPLLRRGRVQATIIFGFCGDFRGRRRATVADSEQACGDRHVLARQGCDRIRRSIWTVADAVQSTVWVSCCLAGLRLSLYRPQFNLRSSPALSFPVICLPPTGPCPRPRQHRRRQRPPGQHRSRVAPPPGI